MEDEIIFNLFRECQKTLEKIAQIEQDLRLQISKLEKQPAEKKSPPPGGSRKQGQKSSKRHK